jgi:predicted O-linked N-acetylglucosamine transferase (SPINDLY family)
LAAADAALKAGRRDEAIRQLTALLEADPAQNVQVYRSLAVQLYLSGRMTDGVRWASAGVNRFPRDVELMNLLGVFYRNLARHRDALQVLDTAAKLAPGNASVQNNRGNILLDLDEPARAEAIFAKLVRNAPRNADLQRQLGRALVRQGRLEVGRARLRQALSLKKDHLDAWLDLIGSEIDEHQYNAAEALIERALAILPDNPKLLEARVVAIRRSGQLRRCETYLLELLPQFPDTAWVHYQLGGVISDYDRERANTHLRRAIELEPDKVPPLIALIESLERTRTGDEGANIEEAYQLAQRAFELNPSNVGYLKVLYEITVRVCAFDELDRVGDFATRGRAWAASGRHTALLKQLGQVKSLDDRYELLEQHRIWGRRAEALAARRPIKLPAPRSADDKIRIGFMSSDLRIHPVGYFTLPLFEQTRPKKFEVYCYSFYQGEHADQMQELFASRSTAFRWLPDINARDAAQNIADDQLDILIELGGSTHMNRLEIMAYRPAPLQASWLGYPHSAGLSTIDYLICDHHNMPPRPDLLIETPLMMPHSWVAFGRQVFSDAHVITPGLPDERAGHVTFGTANNPHKYNPETFALWAQVLLAVPQSRFTFIRPEGGSASFRQNVVSAFVNNGVAADRIQFSTIRGQHMPFYNDLDISLDPFPLTGGTTTAESLWMGVPVVGLVGEAFFERLSLSMLSNCGLADLATPDPERYVRIAAELAADRPRRLDLRRGLRERIRSGPLGDTEQFAADFYDLIARAVRERAA